MKALNKKYRACTALAVFAAVLFSYGSTRAEEHNTCRDLVPDSGYGAPGTYAFTVDSIQNPADRQSFVYFYRPEARGRSPVIFFCHGIGATDPRTYRSLIRHIAGTGMCLIYAQYPRAKASYNPEVTYRTLWAGFTAATEHFSARIDTSKIGFLGHSYGGGAVPSLAHKAFTEKKWGQDGAFLFITAPWYSYALTPKKLHGFPSHVKLVMQVYANDEINDHRMAKDIYENITIPYSEKAYIILHSDSSTACTLSADHSTPTDNRIDLLDSYGIYRVFDALADYSFNKNQAGKPVALNSGVPGKETPELSGIVGHPAFFDVMHTPYLLHPQSYYLNFWKHAMNPRMKYQSHYKARRPFRYDPRVTRRGYLSATMNKRDKNLGLEDPAMTEEPTGVVNPITEGFGSNGPYTINERVFPHPDMGDGNIHVFTPDCSDSLLPVILFAHGYPWSTPYWYQGLIRFIASKGYIVVFASSLHRKFLSSIRTRYDLMLKGFEAAIELVGHIVDTTRIGFAGHSFGAGALPSIAQYYLVRKEWGSNGAFLYLMAPWYARNITQEQLLEIPPHTAMIVQVFDDDRFNDWRIAEDLFMTIQIPDSNKDFLVVHNDIRENSAIRAEHIAPISHNAEDIDRIDFYAIYKTVDALARAVFFDDPAARNTALGNGSFSQRFMGTWPDGIPVTPMSVTDRPFTPHPQKAYLFRWRRLVNRRRKFYSPRE
ncbi:MAG: hypothetical protein GF350_17000 [Chitinivibrionales bacterium]|nr:hypothetical protein [Chitinivibrionales bacterium]